MDILCVGDLNGDLIVPYGKALKQSKGEDPVQVSFRVGGTVSNTVQFLGRLGTIPISWEISAEIPSEGPYRKS